MSARPATRRRTRRICTSRSRFCRRRGNGGRANRSIRIRYWLRHALQCFRDIFLPGIQPQRNRVALLRFRFPSLLLVDLTEPVVCAVERRLVADRRVPEILLERLFTADEV